MADRASLRVNSAWLPGPIAHWATVTPEAIAVECQGRTLTYYELDKAAQRVADHIHGHGLVPGSLVALPVDRRLETVSNIVGILKARCAYLPLDADSPAHRNEQILGQAAPALVFTDAHDLKPRTEPLVRKPADARPPEAAPGLAYVMPTSGSGGEVKLVEVGHESVCHNLQALSATLGGITAQDAYLHVASFAFSSSVRQLFLPLMSGARAVLATGAQRLGGQEMLLLVRDSCVSVLDIIPSVLSVLVDGLDGLGPQRAASLIGENLRLLLLASEPLRGGLIRKWIAASGRPQVAVYNMYGQTETAGIISVHRVDAACTQGTVPIGHSLPGTTLSLLDVALSPVADGAVGEIAAAGPSISRGYRGDSNLTAARFLASPPGPLRAIPRLYLTGDLGQRDQSGTVEFLGRVDRMIKVRGHRVDLAQIERTLETHDAVAEAAVVESAADDETSRIRAYARLRTGYIDAQIERKLRNLPNGLRILDMNLPETDHMYQEIFVRQVYLQHGIALPDDACVIDAGANIGLFSLSVAVPYPNARVLAFEPAAPTASVLMANLRANVCPNVTVWVKGLSDRNGTASLTWYPRASGLSSFHASRADEHATLMSLIAYQFAHGLIPQGHELEGQATDMADAKLVEESLPCAVVRLSDVLNAEGLNVVDLLKVDVQKSEVELLAGIADEHWNRIKQIVAEVHDIDGRLSQMTKQLTQRGYTVGIEQDSVYAGSSLYYLYARRDSARSTRAAALASDVHQSASLRGVSCQELSAFLTGRLPASHMPKFVEILEDFPRTVSGKTDRVLLAQRTKNLEASQRKPDHVDTFTGDIVAIWSEVLGKPAAAEDDFFELGGSSLAAARVVSRIRQRFNAPRVSVRLIFDEPRLDRFTAAIKNLLPPNDDE